MRRATPSSLRCRLLYVALHAPCAAALPAGNMHGSACGVSPCSSPCRPSVRARRVGRAPGQQQQQLTTMPRVLCVDGSNQQDMWLPGAGRSQWHNMAGMQPHIHCFAEAARNSGWELHVFFDSNAFQSKCVRFVMRKCMDWPLCSYAWPHSSLTAPYSTLLWPEATN